MFNRLKEKLKSWISKSKEKVEKTTISRKDTSEHFELSNKDKTKTQDASKKPLDVVEKEEKPKKKDKIIEELPKLKPEEQGTAIEIETEIEEGIPQEEIDKELKEEITKEKKQSFLKKIKSKFAYKITEKEFDEIFEDLEMLLLENNTALEVVEDIKSKLSEKLVGKEMRQKEIEEYIRQELKETLKEILIEPDNPLNAIKIKKAEHTPFIILFFGINGTGKTTTIAKLTHLLQKNNFSCVLAAADTFRAASIEQIQIHADKLKVPLIKHDYGADPSAVGFDAIKYAEKHKIDVVLIDTAGRMHTKINLLAEMEKICRVTNPDLKIFVAESIAGNDATEQAKTFNEMIEIDGSILTKADIDEKGGTIISVSHAIHKPIFYLGTGQNYEDLELFDKQKFIDDLGL